MCKKIGPAVISALPRVTGRQSPAQFARDCRALMLGQSLAERQRFAAMTQDQTRHPIARVGFDLDRRRERCRRSSKCAPSGRNVLPALARSAATTCL
jgi:hypothetical protein